MSGVDPAELAALQLDTHRLRLLTMSAQDEPLYCSLFTDPETLRFIGTPLSQHAAARSFRLALAAMQRLPLRQAFMVVLKKATLEPLGLCSIQQIDASLRSAEAGIILKPEARSLGYGLECFGAWVGQVFALWPIDEIWVRFSVDHSAAEHGALRLGFSPQEEPREARVPGTSVWSANRATWNRAIRNH